jgi:predicted TIM-barrel fold metal-dependent hydrolase
MNRRDFVSAATAGLLIGNESAVVAQPLPFPVIDTHIHLFDPTRPQGVPWPSKDDKVLYQPALPARYRKIAEPFGVAGAIEIECSPLPEDNQWVLDIAAKDSIIVGTIGNLEPGKPEFRPQLDRLRRNPLFLGIRCGNLWGRDLAADIRQPAFVAGLKALADAGLVLDTANQNSELIAATLRVTDLVPNLRIVIDHLPQFTPQADANLRELGQRPQVYVKISEVLRRVEGRVPTDLGFYRPKLDEIFGIFGDYFTAKGAAIAEKYFRKNSVAAYRWKARKLPTN